MSKVREESPKTNDIFRSFPPPLPTDEERQYLLRARWDHEAREKLILHNMRLVILTAKKYISDWNELPDCVNDGVVGLIEAIYHFDPLRKIRFMTYASWRVKKEMIIGRHRRGPYGAYVPLNLVWQKARIAEAVARLESVQTTVNISLEDIARETGFREEKIRRLQRLASPANLEERRDQGDRGRIIDYLPDKNAPDPLRDLERTEAHERITRAMRGLTKRERYVITLRFRAGMTLESISHIFHMSKERIRQIEELALSRIEKRLREEQIACQNRVNSL